MVEQIFLRSSGFSTRGLAGVLAFGLVLGLSVVLGGCATSKSGAGDDGMGEVQGSVPVGVEAEFHAPPRGPEVLTVKSEQEALVESGAGEASAVIARGALHQLIGRGPGYVFGQVETKPVHAGQKFVGFEVVSMSPSAQQAVGSRVRVGDVITHLNGIQQRLPDDYLKAWKMLGDAEHVRVDLIRAGQAVQEIWRVE